MGDYAALRGRIKVKPQYREWFISQLKVGGNEEERWDNNAYGFKFWEDMRAEGKHTWLPDAYGDIERFDGEENGGRLEIIGDVIEFCCSFKVGDTQLAFVALCMMISSEWQIERDYSDVAGRYSENFIGLPVYYWTHQWFNEEQFQRWHDAYVPGESLRYIMTDFALYTRTYTGQNILNNLDLWDLSERYQSQVIDVCESIGYEVEELMSAEERERVPLLERQARRVEQGEL